jgi:hypothetical protein
MALIQIILQLTIFRFDSLTELKSAGKIEGKNGLLEVLGRIYTTDDEV